jgi:hypothetical protein
VEGDKSKTQKTRGAPGRPFTFHTAALLSPPLLPLRIIAYIEAAMNKRLFVPSLFLFSLIFVSAALAEEVEIGKVPMPELTSSEWAMVRQQQGPNQQIIPVDLNLAVNQGVVYAVSIRHGTGYPDIDNTIVRWIANNWRTDNWFRGGDAYVVSLDVDPVLSHVVFRNNAGNVRHTSPLIETLRADVISIVRGS